MNTDELKIVFNAWGTDGLVWAFYDGPLDGFVRIKGKCWWFYLLRDKQFSQIWLISQVPAQKLNLAFAQRISYKELLLSAKEKYLFENKWYKSGKTTNRSWKVNRLKDDNLPDPDVLLVDSTKCASFWNFYSPTPYFGKFCLSSKNKRTIDYLGFIPTLYYEEWGEGFKNRKKLRSEIGDRNFAFYFLSPTEDTFFCLDMSGALYQIKSPQDETERFIFNFLKDHIKLWNEVSIENLLTNEIPQLREFAKKQLRKSV